MRAERWDQVKRICAQVWDDPAGDHAAAIEALCTEDEGMRTLVEELLNADAAAADFLETPPTLPTLDSTEDAPSLATVGEVIAGYEIIRPLGAGGMGEVYLARQRRPSREVALKILPASAARGGAKRAFLREAEALGRLSHPNIAHVYEAGVWAPDEACAPRPFIAMERVEGVPLTTWADEQQPSIRDRVRVMARACEGLAHAHQRGVIHRDIKPSNVLVTHIAGEATPKVIDFGIARFTEPELNDTISHHGAGPLVGTIPYMSPEQVRGEVDAIDTRTDIYALGAALYELLTGRRPFGAEQGAFETMRAICEEPPTPPRRWNDSISRDLEAVTLKALEKSPARRYQFAGELAADLDRVLRREPVAARRHGAIEQLAAVARRHRAGSAVAATLLLSILIGGTATAWQAMRATRSERQALARLDDLRLLTNTLIFELHDEIADIPGATGARRLLVSRGLQFLEQIRAQSGGDRELLKDLADGYSRIAMLQRHPNSANIGDTDGAIASFRLAIALREALSAALPPDRPEIGVLAKERMRFALLLAEEGQEAEARELFTAALDSARARCAALPHDYAIQVELAEIARYAVETALYFGDTATAVERARSVVDFLGALPTVEPADDAERRARAGVRILQGLLLGYAGEVDSALEWFERGSADYRALLIAHPEELSRHQDAGDAPRLCASILNTAGRYEEATQHYQDAAAFYRAGLRLAPDSYATQEVLAITLSQLSLNLQAAGDLEAARPPAHEAHQIMRALAEADPDNEKSALAAAKYKARLAQIEAASSGNAPR